VGSRRVLLQRLPGFLNRQEISYCCFVCLFRFVNFFLFFPFLPLRSQRREWVPGPGWRLRWSAGSGGSTLLAGLSEPGPWIKFKCIYRLFLTIYSFLSYIAIYLSRLDTYATQAFLTIKIFDITLKFFLFTIFLLMLHRQF
jgi:hypothetical protein